jgi:hypothetical protein
MPALLAVLNSGSPVSRAGTDVCPEKNSTNKEQPTALSLPHAVFLRPRPAFSGRRTIPYSPLKILALLFRSSSSRSLDRLGSDAATALGLVSVFKSNHTSHSQELIRKTEDQSHESICGSQWVGRCFPVFFTLSHEDARVLYTERIQCSYPHIPARVGTGPRLAG